MSWVDRLTRSNFAPVDVEKLLLALGIDAEQRGSKWVACCPDPEHEDRSPSWMMRDDPGKGWHGSHNCKACGFEGGPWELVAKVRGIDLDAAAEFVRSLPSRPVDTCEIPAVKIAVRRRGYRLPPGVMFPERIGELHSSARAYLARRGVPDWQIMRWGIGFATIGPLAWRVVVPVYTRGRLVTHTARAVFEDGSRRHDMPDRDSGAKADFALWGEPRFRRELSAVTVAEGVFSAMHLERIGAPNPCALLGSELTEHKIALLSEFPVILVATDPDAAGEKAWRQISAALRRTSYVERVELEASPDDCEPASLRRAVEIATGGFERITVAQLGPRSAPRVFPENVRPI